MDNPQTEWKAGREDLRERPSTHNMYDIGLVKDKRWKAILGDMLGKEFVGQIKTKPEEAPSTKANSAATAKL